MEYRHPGSLCVKKFKTVLSAKKSCSPAFGMQGACVTRNFCLKDRWWIPTGIVQPYNYLRNASAESGRKKRHISFASWQRKATLQCTNSGRHDKPEIHSGSTPSLQPRFGNVRLLAVPKIEGGVKRPTFFIGCRSWDSCVQMDREATRNFLHRRNEQIDRTIEKMCSHKWWLCWKISVQCVREINFFILISLLLFYIVSNLLHTIGDLTYQSPLVHSKVNITGIYYLGPKLAPNNGQ